MRIDEQIQEVIERLHKVLRHYSKVSEDLAQAKIDFETREANEIKALRESGKKVTVRELEALVTLQVKDERAQYQRLDARAKTLLEGLRSVRAELSALQTLAGLEREEAALSRVSPET